MVATRQQFRSTISVGKEQRLWLDFKDRPTNTMRLLEYIVRLHTCSLWIQT